MTRNQMLRHAEEWIAAWNRRDLAAVTGPFADDACFISPKAASVTGRARVEGKAALLDYWTRALVGRPPVEFRLDRVLCDVERREMLVLYDRILGDRSSRACEVMRFDAAGRQIEGEALYGAEE